jgi:Ras-related protein Rab-6A
MTEQDSNEDSVDNSVSVTRHKIIFVGDAGVGKTTIISRIMDNPFNDVYEPSIGVDFMSKNIKFRGQNVKLQMWDTAGQEKYKGLIPSYVRNSSIVFLVYDIASKISFDNIPKWINFIRTIENATLVLCGNKIDLPNREVKKEEAEALAQKEGISFFEVSAKTDENIKNMFYNVVAELPTFSENNPNKENLIKELMQENGVENVVEGIQSNVLKQAPAQKINVDGKEKQVETTNQVKKKKCGC